MENITGTRKSLMELGSIYFWTATIFQWKWLLREDSWKKIIIDSLGYLSARDLIDVFGFVVMPNHIHFIWRLNQLNGKEKPDASFLKFTSHEFQKKLRMTSEVNDCLHPWFESSRIKRKTESAYILNSYQVNSSNKAFQFWERDPLAIKLTDLETAYQKLDYIHSNPLLKDWFTLNDPAKYRFSSCGFYENGTSEFHFLKHLGEEF